MPDVTGIRYVPLLPLGRGGMGTVEAALEPGDPPRIVALKRLRADRAKDTRSTAAFERETRVALLLAHDNVVRAFGTTEVNGAPALVLEYVEGETLDALLEALSARGERMDARLTAWVLAALCEGLHAAHELRGDDGEPLGLVHRDVSPHNVLLGYDGSVRLLDFGVARVEARTKLTQTGEVKGKTAYMSPEQGMGDPLDRRSDLWSVGAVLFECVAGRPLWQGATDLEILRQLALSEPPSLADVAPEAPRELCALCASLLAKDPPPPGLRPRPTSRRLSERSPETWAPRASPPSSPTRSPASSRSAAARSSARAPAKRARPRASRRPRSARHRRGPGAARGSLGSRARARSGASRGLCVPASPWTRPRPSRPSAIASAAAYAGPAPSLSSPGGAEPGEGSPAPAVSQGEPAAPSFTLASASVSPSRLVPDSSSSSRSPRPRAKPSSAASAPSAAPSSTRPLPSVDPNPL
jgi:serine/threonine protein kinase